MQRVRIGLTGLGFVFVLVLLAAALTGDPGTVAPVAENVLGPPSVNQQSAPKEPLAELGASPGNADSNMAAVPANGSQAQPALR